MAIAQLCFAAAATVSIGAAYIGISAPVAQAECTNAGGVTVCAQGQVRGSSGAPDGSSSGPYYPYPCEYDYYCNDWGVDVILDVDRPGAGRPDRPNNSLPGGNRGGGGRGGGGRR